jgi:pimeloyl-ACP methyl ester carboxylesterase
MRFKTSGGHSISYKTRGRGPAIVLFHPVGLCADFWDPVVAQLESDFRLIAVDTRGHGDSDFTATPFKLDDCAQDAAELIRTIGQGPVIAAGCSMGGMIVQAMMARMPDVLRGGVIANTGHRRDDQGRAMLEQRALAAEKGMPEILLSTMNRWFAPEVQALRPDIVMKARDWLLAADPVVHAWSWRAIRDLKYTGQLAATKVPTLAIAGTHDQATSLAAMKDMTASIPGCQYRELATGHLAPLEDPAGFAGALRDFANGLA